MGKDNTFTDTDISRLKKQPLVADVAPLISNRFRVRATAGNVLPFSTDLFLESLDNNFIDTVPPSFTWQPGQMVVPIIFSSDFLEMYNVFAPAQDLPQLSEKTISSINVILECSGPQGMQMFRGNIVALSDRINSLLVPQSFMSWSNFHLTGDTSIHASRLYIKTTDANDPAFLSYLDKENYHVNKDKIQFGRIKGLLQNIVSVLGLFGVLVIALALMLFSFYLQLMIARSKDNLQLLLTLGYSPRWLARSVLKTWLPVYAAIMLVALAIAGLFQYLFSRLSFARHAGLSPVLHWSVWLTALFLFALTLFMNARLVKQELGKIL